MSDIGGPNILPAFILIIIAIVAPPFLIGTIPFGHILGRFGKGAKIAGTFLDVAKILVPAAVVFWLLAGDDELFRIAVAATIAVAAALGHWLSPLLRFKGGKGALIVLCVILGLCIVAFVVVVAALSAS